MSLAIFRATFCATICFHDCAIDCRAACTTTVLLLRDGEGLGLLASTTAFAIAIRLCAFTLAKFAPRTDAILWATRQFT